MRGPESEISEVDIEGTQARPEVPPTREEVAAAEEAERKAARRREEEAAHGPFEFGPTWGAQAVRDQAGSRWDPDADEEKDEEPEEPRP